MYIHKFLLVLCFRQFQFFKLRNWYSTYSWTHPQIASGSDDEARLIDAGALTIGYYRKVSRRASDRPVKVGDVRRKI